MSSSEDRIGAGAALALVVGTMLGVGILLTPPVAVAASAHPAVYYGLWLLGGATALAGATTYAELGALLPERGGDVVFQRAAFGPGIAFASGVVTFGLAFAGSIAAMAVAVAQYQLRTVAEAAGLVIPDPAVAPIAVLLILALTALNAAGLRWAAGFQVAATAVPLALLCGLAAAGLVVAPAQPFVPVVAATDPGALAGAFAAVYFAYAGWPAVAYLASEVRDPGRTLSVGMVGGTVLVTAAYLLLCASFVRVLGAPDLAAAGEAGTALAAHLLGPSGGVGVAAAVAVALLASINGTVLGGARVAAGLADQGGLPRAFSTQGLPVRALWLQAALACGLALTGSFSVILEVTGAAMMVVGSVTVLGLFALRRQLPDAPRPYRALGYPLLPALYVVVSLATVGIQLKTALQEGGWQAPVLGLVTLAALAGGWRAWARRRLTRPRQPPGRRGDERA